MPKKPIVASEEELHAAVAKLEGLIQQAKTEASAAVQATEVKWQAAVKEVHSKADAKAETGDESVEAARKEAKDYTEECVTALNNQLLALFPPIDVKITDVAEDAQKNLEEVDARVCQLIVDELDALTKQFDKELRALQAELSENITDMGREAAEALVDQRRQLDESIERLRQECIHDRACIREEVRQKFQETIEIQHQTDVVQDDAREILRKEVHVEFDKVEEIIKDKERKAAKHSDQVATSAEANRAELAHKNFEHLRRLDGETQQLRDGLREVENVSTRRIEWVVKKASEVMRPPDEGWSPEANHRSFYSPKFNGAGAWGMQFELQLFGPPSKTDDGESGSTGNLGVCVWGCKGTRVACKVYIGDRAKPIEKKFDGCSPASTGRLCWLRDQIGDDDTLRVGIEFLEAMREVEYPSRQPPPPLPLTGRISSDIDGVMRAIEALEGAEPEHLRPFKEHKEVRGENVLEGSMCYMRHLNHRVFDQVKEQVSAMESRMVRKVQWLVQNASKIRQYFPWGQAICSPTFSAAGVDNMQFALYPNGYGERTEGFCSLFLYAPAGCTLHCYLSVAKQVREISHTWDLAGAFGRTNFCVFDHNLFDLVQDTILLTLEIEEAQQEECKPWTHQEAATRKPESHQGSGDKSDLSSITKLTKNPGKAPSGKPNGREGKMDTVAQLQSIWTAKAWTEDGQSNAAIPEGFHSFDEVVNRRPAPIRPDSSGGAKSPKSSPSPSPAGARVKKNESAPSLHDHRGRTAIEEDLSPPLPPVSAGSVSLGATAEHWGSELPGGASSLGMARKAGSRRNRPGSSGATTRFGATS